MRIKVVFAFDIFLLLFAIGLGFLTFFAIEQNVQIARVVSNSMAPSIHRGDTLLFRSEPIESVGKGEILLLPLADGSGRSYVHRVVEKRDNSDSSITVLTKGDANPVPDSWKLTIRSPEVPVYLATIPTSNIPLIDFNSSVILGILAALLIILLPLLIPKSKSEPSSDEESDE